MVFKSKMNRQHPILKALRYPGRMISYSILRLLGWRIVSNLQPEIRKAVILVAPHTSNMDFILGRLGYNYLDFKGNFLIKKEFFFFPVGLFLKAMGGIPVDRKNPGKLVETLIERFARKNEVILTITPEGTRKKVKTWKKGFHQIAMAANVPLIFVTLDYSKKLATISPAFIPDEDYNVVLQQIREHYKDIKGRHPEKFSLPQ